MNVVRRSILFFFCFVLLSIGGAYATWHYAMLPPLSVEKTAGVSISVFEYAPEEILPGGESQEAELGQNHLLLIDLILNERDKGYGLNYSNNGILHKYLNSQGVVYSNQKVSGGNLKFILDPKNNTHNLYYCLEKISNTEYYIYTFSTAQLSSYGGSELEFEVYRTTAVKTDKWRATVSFLGYAQTKSLRDLDVSADPNTIPYSIDVTTWRMQYYKTAK